MTLEDKLSVFDIPLIWLDRDMMICRGNQAFTDMPTPHLPCPLGTISSDFKQRRFDRRMADNGRYRCRITLPDSAASYWLELVRDDKADDGYLGFLTDASEMAKAEAMMASYSAMIERQNNEIKEKTEQLAIWSKRIKQELEQAETVQDLLVPHIITKPGLESHCVPVRELSGDFHDALIHEDGQMTFISGDVAGKGIYAAIILAQALAAFRAYYETDSLPKLAARIVEALDGRVPDGLFVALSLVRLSQDKQSAEILNLGNPDALVVAQGHLIQTVPAKGPAIGILPALFYEGLAADHVSLSNARLYVFSDGIIDFQDSHDSTGFADAQEANAFICAQDKQLGENALSEIIEIAKRHVQKDDIMIACLSPS